MLKHFSALLAAFLLCSISAYAQQQPLTSARDYWNIPVSETIQRANDGDPFAQYTLAAMHYTGGNGPVRNQELAYLWYEKARGGLEPLATQGNSEAQYLLGELSLIPKDTAPFVPQNGIAYLQQAAQQGHVHAQIRLAGIYQRNPYDIDPDPALANYWLEQALPHITELAKQGDPQMQFTLFTVYKTGSDQVAPDPQQAQYWQQQYVQGFRNEIASLGQKPLRFFPLYMLSIYYQQSDDNEQQSNDPVKAYTTASILVERFSMPAHFIDSAEDLLRSNSDQLRHAQQLAQQCLRELTDACY